jgi:hypothetical protein
MTKHLSTFEVSKEGLAKLLDRRGGRAFAVSELIQNAWDENTTRVDVTLVPTDRPGDATLARPYVLTVTDDNPTGFADLSHAYTLFAESAKKANPEKRGRFNLGEKFVIAICDWAMIQTTTGTVEFGEQGRAHSDDRRESGSVFQGVLALTETEVAEIARLVHALIPPSGIVTTYNGETIATREPLATFSARLQTEWADEDGRLHRNDRKTTVEVYEPEPGETASLYEMGLPVVETGDRWHINVGQKVPLNMDRDNVTPAYLRAVRAETLNHAHEYIRETDSDATWITEALTDSRATSEAIDAALDRRFGERRVVFDPSDPEANKRAAAAGYTVIAPRSLPKGVAGRARELGVLAAAGAVTPSPNPYGDGPPRSEKRRDDWSPAEIIVAGFAEDVGSKLVGRPVRVVIVNDPKCQSFQATYSPGSGTLEYNLCTLGRRFFEDGPLTERALSLLIHELAHQYSSDHLSERYYDGCTDLGARLARLALADPALFARYDPDEIRRLAVG